MTYREERYYSDIVTIAEAQDATSANDWLKAGWELLKIEKLSKISADGKSEDRIVYVLGFKDSAKAKESQEEEELPDFDKLEWKQSSFDKTGKTESVPPDRVPTEVKDFMEKRGSFTSGGYRYSYSKSGWLNRRKL